MSTTSAPLRATTLALLLVLSMVAGSIAVGPAAARDTVRSETTSSPVVLFMGEQQLNITETYRAATGSDPGDTVTLAGTAGQADGGIVSVDPTDVDVTAAAGFDTGAYSINGSNGDVHISVRDPSITALSLYRGNDDSGAEITGGHLPRGENVTVTAEFDFASAEYLEVSIVNENGVEITPELVPDRPARINESAGSLTLDVTGAQLEAGETYTVHVEGAELDDANRATTFAIREAQTTLSLAETSVTRGESVVGTVIGPPGGTVTVRVGAADVEGDATNETARSVFKNTGAVLTNAVSGNGMVGVVLTLGDDGSAQVLIDTGAFVAENTAEIVVADGGSSTAGAFTADAQDEVDLVVNERRITIESIPDSVRIGEQFAIEGSAPEADDVKAYARIGDAWEPLYEEANGELATADVETGGDFTLTVDSTAVINLPDTYRVGVAVGPGSDIEPTGSIADTTFADLTTDTETIAAQKGALHVSLSSQRVAAEVGDDVRLTGQAPGQGRSLRAYLVGPRGEVYPSETGEVIDIEENRIDHEFSTFDRRGTYTLLVVGRGRDGRYAHASRDAGTKTTGTPAQNVAIIREHYTGAGVDDILIERQIVALNPFIAMADPGTDGQVTPGNLTVQGTSNREDGTTVFVEVLDANGDVIASTDSTVNGSANAWSAQLGLADATVGNYTIRATDNEVTAEKRIRVVEEIATPTPTTPAETPFETGPSPTPQVVTVRKVEIETEVVTRVVTPEPTESPGGQPGLGAGIAAVAIVAATLLAVRRER